MPNEKQEAIQSEMHRIKSEMDALVTSQLAGMCAELRLENAALRKALAEKDQPAP
jgi:hypothetical protein